MVIEIITKLIANLGFPIFVAVFMLLKTSNDNKNLTEAINQLSVKIDRLLDRTMGGIRDN